MDTLTEMMNLNQATLILANKRASLVKGWADKGSILDRAREILEHAGNYLTMQCEELGNSL